MNKRQLTIVGLALLVIAGVLGWLILSNQESAPASGNSAAETIGPGELHVAGNPNAKVVFIEYAALACPFCAMFNNRIIPVLKEKYVNTGKIHYVFRIFPIDPADYKASGLIACLPREKYFDAVDLLYLRQDEWGPEQLGEHGPGFSIDSQPKTDAALVRMGRAMGLDETKSRACMRDQSTFDAVNRISRDGEIRYGVQGTPTLIINGQAVRVPTSPEALSQLLDPLLEGK